MERQNTGEEVHSMVSSLPGSLNEEHGFGSTMPDSPSGNIPTRDEVDRPSSPRIAQPYEDEASEEYITHDTQTQNLQSEKLSTLRRVRIQKKNSRYYFQHPYLRLFICYFIIFCNFLIYAEDPVAHSLSQCTIPVIGNVFAFVVNNYPPNGWAALKFFMWFFGMITGMLIGKFFVHKLLLRKWMKLSMFQEDKGSWMVMFLTTIVLLFVFSLIFNGLVSLGGSIAAYKVTSFLGFTNKTFMKAAAMGTWMGDFVTAWMVTDMMLQDKLYPHWNKRLRKWWQAGWNRIVMFWIVLIVATVIVATAITTDYLDWDRYNRWIVSSNELSRAFLAAIILVFDLCIVMQDWDFPMFRGNMDIKLPGVDTASVRIRLPRCLRKEKWYIHITGKWFNYGIIMLVIILDLNMWKNQIFYNPYEFGQYTLPSHHICYIEDRAFLATANETMVSYDWRATHINPATNLSYASADRKMNAKYFGYSLGVKSTAFIPSIAVFILFGLLIWFYGREEFVVDAVVVDGASVQGIIIESYDSEYLPDPKPPATDDKRSGKPDESPNKNDERLNKKFADADSEVAGGETENEPKLLNVQKVTYV